MTEKTVYIAFDGKEFEDYSECERYESKELENKYGKDLLVYDENGELIALDNDYWLSQSSAYIICKSEEALSYLNKIFKNSIIFIRKIKFRAQHTHVETFAPQINCISSCIGHCPQYIHGTGRSQQLQIVQRHKRILLNY